MDYACERGIPLSQFLGRVETVPLWLPEDRAVVSVWQEDQSQQCMSCRRFDWEQEENAEAWVAGIHLCVFCKSIEELKEQTYLERRNLPSEGFKVRLYRGEDHNGN